MSYCGSRSVSSHALQAKPRSPGLSHARLTERVLREAGQIDEGPEDEHLGTGAFPLTWSTGTGGSDRGWYRPRRDFWHYWPASGWFNLRPVSYTHLRAHETDSYLVCRLLLEKKKQLHARR